MFRALHFQRPMTRLALIAVLMMALSPAVSRWIASSSTQWLPGLVELCTVQGLKLVDVSGFGGDPAKSPPPGHAMQADCAYCPLLAGAALLLLAGQCVASTGSIAASVFFVIPGPGFTRTAPVIHPTSLLITARR